MSAQPQRYPVDDDTRAKPLIREARDRPVIVEIDGNEYNVIVTPSSPFTLESAFGSAPIRNRNGQPVTDEELEAIIDRAKAEHAQKLASEN
jgi:hypothetical protein